MAGFEGIKWASHQMCYDIIDDHFEMLPGDAKTTAVSKSIHYGMFLTFEGIRFFCRRNEAGALEIIFLNWDMNLQRFQQGIAFNLSRNQQHLVPSADKLEHIFVRHFFEHKAMRPFFEEMADTEAQGYLRPFTVDEDQSIGVTFPARPSIRAVVCRYDSYLGEPYKGVVVPNVVRAVKINGTGCLKLSANYLMSIKSVDMARAIVPDAATALLLDDQVHKPLEERLITEWDTSCCLFAFRDGTVVKIPESPLILPSVTIQGIVSILQEMGVNVLEQDISYGRLLQAVQRNELVTVCSIGTAGILNRCQELHLVNSRNEVCAVHRWDSSHPLFQTFADARRHYWDIYRGLRKIPAGMRIDKYELD
ncbi:aminotransferase class IV [candidate division KSB1 bacterium]|nr:aminotransferase class IV [candidate division KSB1 bacterium]